MSVAEVLSSIVSLAKKYSIDLPYIVGGVPRDYAMNSGPIKTTDIDITTNTSDNLRLGVLSADLLNLPFNIFDDNHITIYFDDYSIDFSSNFKSDRVIDYLRSKNINDERLFEVYSRDFSINTLHQDIISKEVIDLTGSGIDDLKNGIIKTPVDPDITFSDDPRRIFRAIYFASKYDFNIDESIVNYVLKNNKLLYDEKISDKFITSKINKAIKLDSKKTIDYLKKMNILSRVPLVGDFKDHLIKNKLILDYLNGDKKLRAESVRSINRKISIAECIGVEPPQDQLDAFVMATKKKESGGNYGADNPDSGNVALGAYQIMDFNWYGRAPRSGYFFNPVAETGGGCLDKLYRGRYQWYDSKTTRAQREKLAAMPCYEYKKKGESLDLSYSWAYIALGQDATSAEMTKENQDKVARHFFKSYFKKFYCQWHRDDLPDNSLIWKAVAVSWYGGEGEGASVNRSREKICYKKNGCSEDELYPSVYDYGESYTKEYIRNLNGKYQKVESEGGGEPTSDQKDDKKDDSAEGKDCFDYDFNPVPCPGIKKENSLNDRLERLRVLDKIAAPRGTRISDSNPRTNSTTRGQGNIRAGIAPRKITYEESGGNDISFSGIEPEKGSPNYDILKWKVFKSASEEWGSYPEPEKGLDYKGADVKFSFKSSGSWGSEDYVEAVIAEVSNQESGWKDTIGYTTKFETYKQYKIEYSEHYASNSCAAMSGALLTACQGKSAKEAERDTERLAYNEIIDDMFSAISKKLKIINGGYEFKNELE